MTETRVQTLRGLGLHVASLMLAGKIAPEDLEVLSSAIAGLCSEDHECVEPSEPPPERQRSRYGAGDLG